MKKTTTLLAVAAVATVLLSGCGFTPEGEAVRLAIKEYGAKAADAELVNLEWAICHTISVGAFKRRYGQSPAKAAAWRTLCEGAAETPVAVPEK